MDSAIEQISARYKASRANIGLPPKHIKRDYVARTEVDLDGWGLERLGFDPERHFARAVFQFDAELHDGEYEVLGETKCVELVEGETVDHVTITRDDLAAHMGADRLRKMEDDWAEDIAAELDYNRANGNPAVLERMKA